MHARLPVPLSARRFTLHLPPKMEFLSTLALTTCGSMTINLEGGIMCFCCVPFFVGRVDGERGGGRVRGKGRGEKMGRTAIRKRLREVGCDGVAGEGRIPK